MDENNQPNKVGRPTNYDPSFVNRVDSYLETTGRENTSLPTVEGFAIYLGVTKKTLYNWSEKHPEFLHSLDQIMTVQARQLIDDGIYGGKEVNATIVKLLLMNNHGMRERKDTTSDDKPLEFGRLSDEQLEQFINAKIGKDRASRTPDGEGEKGESKPA